MSPKTSVLEPLRVRIRRFQFIVGLGFLALIGGSILSVALTLRLAQRIQALPSTMLRELVAILLGNLWVLGVLPMLCYGAARVMELRPWKTAAGAALSGTAFLLFMSFAQGGVGALWDGGMGSVFNVVAFGVGIALSARAVKLGRSAAEAQSQKSQSKSEERKSEYEEFLRAAEQGGARLEQREAAAAAQPSPEATNGAAPSAGDVAATPAAESGRDAAPLASAAAALRSAADAGRGADAAAVAVAGALQDAAQGGVSPEDSASAREGAVRGEPAPGVESIPTPVEDAATGRSSS
ncbi:hypothetical protein LY474_09315 [Myxococcus stipitatus]|uniref:hypothetical protein n=1 Tax=Myxococcus stipitatus TaxID=83455 RepID=UPI001F42D588|nr:hypothetical protein [Myxococcus stipitatus]MCE9668009.1 hypothetical protein [Myxococcus stipitatus]